MQLKHYHYIIGAYGTLLLVSLAVFYLFPKNISSPESSPGGAAEPHLFYETLLEGKPEQLANVRLLGQKSFAYEDRRLEIVPAGALNSAIFVERAATESGEIAVEEYITESILSHRITPHTITLQGSRLSIAAVKNRFKFFAFNREFTAAQFAGKKTAEDYMELSNQLNAKRALYLRVPAGVAIVYDSERVPLSFVRE